MTHFRKIVMTVVALVMCVLAQAQVERPRLVVGIVVDQMRWDYLYTYRNQCDGGGFQRLLSEGYSCANTMINYLPTVTACSHASIYTGTVPAIHGIVSTSIRVDGRMTYSVHDDAVNGVGTSAPIGHCSPRNLLVTTVGDELRLASGGKSKVVSVALKDRASVLPGGHTATAAYWFDRTIPGFVSSSYYVKTLPAWVDRFNKQHSTQLTHDVETSQVGVTATFDMAKAALRGEELGQRAGVTDMLALSISSTDKTAHKFGIYSPQVDSCYVQLDRELAAFFGMLDETVGRGNYLLFLTADHGATRNFNDAQAQRLPSGVWNSAQVAGQLREMLKSQFGCDSLLEDIDEFNVYISREKMRACGLDEQAVKAVVSRFLLQDEAVERVIDMECIAFAPVPHALKERLSNSYHSARSGQLFVMLKPGYYEGNGKSPGSNHGTFTADDSHIPLVFMGWGVKPGETFAPVRIVDIAPTLCAFLHIQMPSGCMGEPVLNP